MNTFSPMRLGTLLAGVAVTALIGLAVIVEGNTRITILPEDVSRALWFVAVLAWFGHMAAICRDSIIKRIDALAVEISDSGDSIATSARLDGMRQAGEALGGRPHLVR